MQEEHIDWEMLLKTASKQAVQASKNSERALGGVAGILAAHKRHEVALSRIAQSQKEQHVLLSSIAVQSNQINHRSEPLPPGRSIPTLWKFALLLPAAIIALLVFGIT